MLFGFRRMGFVAEGGNEALLERTVKAYFAKLLKIQDRTPAALMRQRPDQLEKLVDPEVERGELQELMRSFEYPEDWFYVERACVLMFWLAAQLDPELDTMSRGLPLRDAAHRPARAGGSGAQRREERRVAAIAIGADLGHEREQRRHAAALRAWRSWTARSRPARRGRWGWDRRARGGGRRRCRPRACPRG